MSQKHKDKGNPCSNLRTSVKDIKTKSFSNLFVITVSFFLLTHLVNVPLLNNIAPALAQKSSSAVQRGYNLLKKGWVNDAIKAFGQALKQNPQSLQAKVGLAISYNRAGRITEAWHFWTIKNKESHLQKVLLPTVLCHKLPTIDEFVVSD